MVLFLADGYRLLQAINLTLIIVAVIVIVISAIELWVVQGEWRRPVMFDSRFKIHVYSQSLVAGIVIFFLGAPALVAVAVVCRIPRYNFQY